MLRRGERPLFLLENESLELAAGANPIISGRLSDPLLSPPELLCGTLGWVGGWVEGYERRLANTDARTGSAQKALSCTQRRAAIGRDNICGSLGKREPGGESRGPEGLFSRRLAVFFQSQMLFCPTGHLLLG